MQLRKSFALVAAALVALGASGAGAQQVNSVAITKPANGKVLGIDSTFVVTVQVQDFIHNASDGVLIYLFQAGGDSTVGIAGYASNSPTLGSASAGSNTAVVTILKGTTTPSVASAAASADSVKISSDKSTYTWYGKVTGNFGTVSTVRAAAYAYDADGATTSAVKRSDGSVVFGVDGDRPTSPSSIVVSGGINKPKGGTARTFTWTGGTLASYAVSGIGDTIAFNVKLGSAANSVFTGSNNLSVVTSVFGKSFTVPSAFANTQDTIAFRRIITAGDFGNVVGNLHDAYTDTISAFVVDAAGNRSNYSNTDTGTPSGVTSLVTFLVDATAPILDGAVVAGDTILPVSNDTITDGKVNTATFLGSAISADLNPIQYNLAEALDSLAISFVGTTTGKVTIINSSAKGGATADFPLKAGATVSVDFSGAHSAKTTGTFSAFGNSITTENFLGTGKKITGKITTGLQQVTFQGVDLAGNKGPVLTRENVYVDIDNLSFTRLFPTAASNLDTLEEATSKVVFALSEDADSVVIAYTPLAGVGTTTRKRVLVGSELKASTGEQTITVDSLVSNTQYQLQLLGADLAGNYSVTTPDTFVYDTTYVVPVIASFKIISTSVDQLTTGTNVTATNLIYRPAAGDTVNLQLQAKTISNTDAVTYKKTAILKISGGSLSYIKGTGLDGADGRYTLTADDWVTGSRVVSIVTTTAPDTLSLSIVDSNDVTNIYTGVGDSVIISTPNALSQIVMTADDTVGQGDAFWVGLSLADKFANNRAGDAAFVQLSTSALGVQLPTNAIPLTKGVGGFWANSAGFSGDLTINAVVISGSGAGTGGATGTSGSLTVNVDGDGATVLDPVAEVIGEDYKGALGQGDQGGFVILTFPVSGDHATLSGYRIYRKVMVNYALAEGGGLMQLSEPMMEDVPWGRVDAIPGQSIMRVVVATLDGDATAYSVAAERGGLSNKEAFDTGAAVSSPYELMAQTMMQSKEAAQIDPAAPVFATLSPEALAFSANGVVPRFKSTGDVLLSLKRETATPVRALDNIPPAAVVGLQVEDTPGDVGSSITVRWAKSADDRMLSTTVPNAIGETQTYTTAGVTGYNIYRRIGDAAWQMVGQTAPGETTFNDVTAINGVRYAYKVEAHDADNVTDTNVQKSAMAIRNNVVGANGQPIYGLFGADSKVDIDDFFIFADHFGLQAGADGYDRAFDLSNNNVVDLADFFVFADNFGMEMAGAGKVVPTMSGLNSDARFYLAADAALPRVGEELSVAVSLENYVEMRGYGLTVEYDSNLLEFVGPRVDNNVLGESELAAPQVLGQGDGTVTIAAFGKTVGEGDLGLNLIFRAKQEIESSYIELTSGALQDGSYGLNRITSPVSIRVETRPEVYALEDNYPNPFNPETTIKYQLPEAGQVTLEVYNMLGQVVKTLVDNQFQNAGRYALQWDATNNSGQPLSSGVYFYRITAGGEFQSHKKMLLLK